MDESCWGDLARLQISFNAFGGLILKHVSKRLVAIIAVYFLQVGMTLIMPLFDSGAI